MKTKWILENDVFGEGHPEAMYKLALDQGLDAVMVGYIPFGSRELVLKNPGEQHSKIGIDMFEKDDCVVVYGSINLVNMLYSLSPWTPTAWFNLENLSCHNYYPRWGRYLLQREYAFIPFGELPSMSDFLYRKIGEGGCIFVRPDRNTKSFNGRVVAQEDFLKWYDTEVGFNDPDPGSMVVVAKPVNLDGEWRFVVGDGHVISSSSYRISGKLDYKASVPSGATLLAETVAQDHWQPDEIYVVDICMTNLAEFKVVEIGSVNCAGLYGCDVGKVMDAMTRTAMRQWTDLLP